MRLGSTALSLLAYAGLVAGVYSGLQFGLHSCLAAGPAFSVLCFVREALEYFRKDLRQDGMLHMAQAKMQGKGNGCWKTDQFA